MPQTPPSNSTVGTLNLEATRAPLESARQWSSVIDSTVPAARSSISSTAVVIGAGRSWTINDWVNGIDIFTASRIRAGRHSPDYFTGLWRLLTNWQSFDSEITPVPESATYGALNVGLSTLFAGGGTFAGAPHSRRLSSSALGPCPALWRRPVGRRIQHDSLQMASRRTKRDWPLADLSRVR